jgi:hypothetical protein
VAGVGPDIEIVPFNNDLNTLLRGVCERVFFVKGDGGFVRPPRPQEGVFSRRLQATRDALVPLLPSTAPCTHQQFVDSYQGRKRRLYQGALDRLRAGRSRLEEESALNIFVKFEKTDRTTKADPVPRVISPRDPRFNIRVGRYLKPLEKRIFTSIKRLFGDTTVLKGYNAVESARIMKTKWDDFRNPVAVGLDASRFDQHVSLDALRWEHSIYGECFRGKHRDRLKRLLSYQEVNHCTGYVEDGTVKYSIEGTRMSGDMNTSLGNCLLMCSMIHAYSLFTGVRLRLANNGDDCVVFMEKHDLNKFMAPLSQWFLEMGFNMAVEEPVYDFDAIEFCQTKPVFDGADYIMCRNPHTAIIKDSVMLKNWDTSSVYRGWLDAVGTGGLALAGQLPVFQELYSAYIRSGKRRPIPQELLPWSFRQLSEGVNRKYGSVHPACRSSFYTAFGITPDEQECLERYYSGIRIGDVPVPYAPRVVFA